MAPPSPWTRLLPQQGLQHSMLTANKFHSCLAPLQTLASYQLGLS